ncbi:Death-associated protein kinase 1 like protein [Argiope bruennichi]|uniref:Death-associated protein kinase 1 like protein n=1 Tax=Argiope bruennichi TaxID=94029 RepID=A0A8T0EK17_ARGBR|nr:Death-associated protein kinase 1 like protein [Argiope bruennichi]
MSLLHDLIQEGCTVQRLRRVLEMGENPNIRTRKGTPLTVLASYRITNSQEIENGLQMARELISFGASVNMGNEYGWTPLINAVRARNYRMVQLLLEANADVNQKDVNGNAALHHAVVSYRSAYIEMHDVDSYNRKIRIVKTLMRYNCELDLKNRLNQTPLMRAVGNRDYLIVKELLKRNVSLDARDIYQTSIMQYALKQPDVDVDIVLELVRYGCAFPYSSRSEKSMALYFRGLSDAPPAELRKAKNLIKVFLFDGNFFTHYEFRELDRMSRERKDELLKFCRCCTDEMMQMDRDEIVPNYYVYNMALRGVYYRNVDDSHLPLEVFDKVLDKLLKGQYPVYCDFILSGICRPYLNKKFAEICSSVETTGGEFLSFDALHLLASHLSHRDMLNMMLACSPSAQEEERTSRRSYCSIS